MDIEFFRVDSSTSGLIGYEIRFEGEWYCVFKDQSVLSGLRLGKIASGLNDTLTRTLLHSGVEVSA